MAGPRDQTITLENVQIIFRNFSGKAGMYNLEGDRSFAVKLTPEWAEEMINRGWNVKYLRPREEDEAPQPYITVKVNFESHRPPKVFMITSRARTQLDAETVGMIDYADILNVDLILNPYNYTAPGGKTGISVYLDSAYITIIEDALAQKYDNMEFATVEGPMMQRATGPDPEPPRS